MRQSLWRRTEFVGRPAACTAPESAARTDASAVTVQCDIAPAEGTTARELRRTAALISRSGPDAYVAGSTTIMLAKVICWLLAKLRSRLFF